MNRMNYEENRQVQIITEFTHLSPFFKYNRVRQNKQPVVIYPSAQKEDETMVRIDREHETKKKSHNSVLGKNFFIHSTNNANRSIIKTTTGMGRVPRKRAVPLFNGPPPEEADVVDWNQVHKPSDIIENENENIILLSRILEIEPNKNSYRQNTTRAQ